MKNFKKSVFLMMNGIQAGMSTVAGVIILLIGIAMVFFEVIVGDGMELDVLSFGFGEFFMALGMMWPMQLLLSVTTVGSVAASPASRKLKTSTPVLASAVTSLAVLAILVILRLVMAAIRPGSASGVSVSILFFALATFALAIYSAFCYRYFVASLVVLVLIIMPYSYTSGFSVGSSVGSGEEASFLTGMVSEALAWAQAIPVPAAIGIACVIIVLANLIMYGFQLLLYKVPLSKYAFGVAGRKALG